MLLEGCQHATSQTTLRHRQTLILLSMKSRVISTLHQSLRWPNLFITLTTVAYANPVSWVIHLTLLAAKISKDTWIKLKVLFKSFITKHQLHLWYHNTRIMEPQAPGCAGRTLSLVDGLSLLRWLLKRVEIINLRRKGIIKVIRKYPSPNRFLRITIIEVWLIWNWAMIRSMR